MKKEKRKFPFT
nr:unnamed protein product [Callosobruchus chinensis]